MGRPKRYPTPAARQAAYRQRLAQEMVPVNRASLAQWEDRLAALLTAIRAAARAHEPLACAINQSSDTGILDNLTAWFSQHGKEGGEP
jgi:hypothetical protein